MESTDLYSQVQTIKKSNILYQLPAAEPHLSKSETSRTVKLNTNVNLDSLGMFFIDKWGVRCKSQKVLPTIHDIILSW